jgi:beta-lactamase regulating signal transducer with metallopeptidase domain
MTQPPVFLFDHAARLVWTAGVQFTLFGTALLVPMRMLRRRPAGRHFLASAALVTALMSPLAAVCSYRLNWAWVPVPPWLFLVERQGDTATVNDRSQPVARLVAPPGAVASPSLLDEAPRLTPEPGRRTPATIALREEAGDFARRPDANPPSGDGGIEQSTAPPAVPPQTVANRFAGGEQPRPPKDDRASEKESARRRSSLSLVFLRSGLVLWLFGVSIISAWLVQTRARLKRLIDRAWPVVDQRVLALMEQTAASLQLSATPALLAAESVTNPFVAFAQAPKIIVPASLVAPELESLLSQVLVHECGHIARYDLRIGWIQAWSKVLCWPHLLVHFYSAVLSQAREELCDNLVLLKVSPTDYARTLLTVGEIAVGMSPAAGISLFSRRDSLSARIARLLDPRRDRSVRLAGRHRAVLASVTAMLAVAVLGVRAQEPPRRPPLIAAVPAAMVQKPSSMITAVELVRKLAACSVNWMAPSPSIESLEYDFLSGPEITRIKVKRGERRRHGVWIATTLRAGFHELMKSPDKLAIEVTRGADRKTLILTAKVKDEAKFIGVEVGNGIENSWRGYFSHRARQTTIVVDEERMVPLEEQTGATTIRYSDWQMVGPGRWVPRRVDINGSSAHYRVHFAWSGDAVWLAQSSESIGPEGTVTLTRAQNVMVNGRAVAMPASHAQQRSRETTRSILSMLDHNRTWLDGGATGSGWRPPFETLSYTFHTVREDVRESCVMDRNGEVAFEVAGDGKGKMKGQLGNRSIALNTEEYASSRRGAGYAMVQGRTERDRGQPFDLALKRYARIGCRLDLPLFHYRERVDFMTVAIEDGKWNGQPCRIATVSNLGGGVVLGCGTMLAFTSWSYMHHLRPIKEVIVIDPERQIPLHETLTSDWQQKVFEIDFADYVEVEPGQWAPRTIRIEAKDSFTCEYQFQLVGGKHWMLKEVVSWFKPDDKSRGMVEDVRLGGSRELLDDALRQVGAARTLFGGAGEIDRKVDVAVVPFVLGRAIRVGPYEIRVTTQDERAVSISALTNDPTAARTVPLCFLDERHRPLFAPAITLQEQGGSWQGSVAIRGSTVWRNVRSITVSSNDASMPRLPVSVVPFRWGETIAVNIPDAGQVESSTPGGKKPLAAYTRAFRFKGEQAANGTNKLTLNIVSIDGPREFFLDLAVMLLGESGELIASGHCSTTLRVEHQPAEQSFEIDLGKIPVGVRPKFVAIGVVPGNVVSRPMGSRWFAGWNLEPPFDITALLAAPDDACRRAGLAALGRRETDESIRNEFLSDRVDDRRVGDGTYSRRTLLQPHAEALIRIVRESSAADVKAGAARFLAYSEAAGASDVLKPLVSDSSPQLRDAVAIGLTFLGQREYLDRLRAILKTDVPLGKTQAEIAAWQSFRRVDDDTLIALARGDSVATVDLLGEALLGDLKNLRPVTNEKKETKLEGRLDRVNEICKLLGATDNRRAVHWLTAAVDLIAGRPDLTEHFEQSDLARSMLKFREQTRDRIASELITGKTPAAWAYVLQKNSDPYFVPAVRKLFERKDVPIYAMHSGVQYLWNVSTPEAVDVLRAAYDRGLTRAEPRLWLRLCEALAANGDGRGLGDAFDIMVGLKQSAQPPADEQERRSWQSARNNRIREAEAVFSRPPKHVVAEFLLRKTQVASTPERHIVLQLLWKLPEVPKSFAAVLEQWAKSADHEVAEMAARLRKRD